MSQKVFFEIDVDGKRLGRLEFELFSKDLPKTTKNFYQLCTGESGMGKQGKKLHFKGSHFHRIIPGFMAQGGDFTKGNGTGGESIYGTKFADEGFKFKHDKKGMLSMANAGPNTNGSQFFLTFVPCPWLDKAHVVFGRMTKGEEVLDKMETYGSKSGKTSKTVTIADCGAC